MDELKQSLKGRGPVATMLVQKGTLHVGDTARSWIFPMGRGLWTMHNSKGVRVTQATPRPTVIFGCRYSSPVRIIFSVAVDNEKEARTDFRDINIPAAE